MKIFAIKNDDTDVKTTCYLIYYEIARKFQIEIINNVDEWSVPMYFSSFAKKNIKTINPVKSLEWVRQRIAPTDRQNIAQILIDNKITGYDEFSLLIAGNGRCSQDDYFLQEIKYNDLPDEIQKRTEKRIDDIIPLSNYKLLVFFKDGTTRICEFKKIINKNESLKNYLHLYPERFFDVKIQEGGTGIYWNDNMIISDVEIYQGSKKIPLLKNDFSIFIRDRIVNSAEAAELLNCSRQNIDDLVKRGKLIPIKETKKDRLFYESDILKRYWN